MYQARIGQNYMSVNASSGARSSAYAILNRSSSHIRIPLGAHMCPRLCVVLKSPCSGLIPSPRDPVKYLKIVSETKQARWCIRGREKK
jgi:hypothetical protein